MSIKGSNVHLYRFKLAYLHPRYWLTWLGLALYFLFTLLPMRMLDWFGERLGDYVASKNRKRFNIVKVNLSLCFPDKTEQQIEHMVRQHFRAQLRSMMHLFLVWWRPEFMLRRKIVREGFEQIDQYKAQGKQIIVLISHCVGLEFAVASVTMDYNFSGPYKPMRNKIIDYLFSHGRLRFGAKFGGRIFTREDGLRPLIKETRSGKVLIYLGDEDLGGENAVFVPFFGVTKATIPILGRLAKTCNAVVLPCMSCYDPAIRKYRVKMLPLLENFPSGYDVVDSTAMNQAIERTVQECPTQYLWTLRYFQTRPQGEASVYE